MSEITPGKYTTEYEQTQQATWIHLVGLVLGLIVQVGAVVLPMFDGNEQVMIWGGIVLQVATTLYNTLVTRGYVVGRSDIKIARLTQAKP